MQPSDDERLRHMLDAAGEALAILGDHTVGDVAHNRLLALSLVKLIEIVGEAAAGVSPQRRSLIATIDWPRMIATRNRLIHGYYDVDVAVVVQTIRDDLPSLVGALERALGGRR